MSITAVNRRLLLLLTAGLLTLTACQKPASVKVEEPPRPVRVLKIGPSLTGERLELPAEVRPRFETRYGFRIGGKIATRSVALGDLVKPGQELARIDPADITPALNTQSAQLEAARSEVQLQSAELKRTRELRERNFISQAQLDRQVAAHDAAAARMRAAEAQLRQVRTSLEHTSLRADKAGVVTAVDAEAGQVVAVGQSVVRVAQLGEKEVVVNLPEADVERLRRASRLTIRVAALGDRPFAVSLRELSPVADPASRTFFARLTVAAASDDLKLGMSATLTAEMASSPSLVVPLSALKATGEQAQVWVVDPATNSVRETAVRLGAATDRGVIIAAGLSTGDLVVTAGAHLLIPGQKVRVLE